MLVVHNGNHCAGCQANAKSMLSLVDNPRRAILRIRGRDTYRGAVGFFVSSLKKASVRSNIAVVLSSLVVLSLGFNGKTATAQIALPGGTSRKDIYVR